MVFKIFGLTIMFSSVLEGNLKVLIKYIFQSLCLFSVIVLNSWCYYKYTLDKDISSLNYKFFNQDESSIYPSMSLCVVNPYIEHRLEKYGKDVNSSSYAEFLLGKYWSNNMSTIVYDEVTIDLNDFIKGLFIQLRNGTKHQWSKGGENSLIPSFYANYKSPLTKCFTIDMPYIKDVQISTFQLMVHKRIFPGHIRPPRVVRPIDMLTQWAGFGIIFHYPGQQLRSFSREKYSWPSREENNGNSYAMIYRFSSMEVWKRRNKPSKPCIDKWVNDDKYVLEKVMEQVGCRPTFWSYINDLPICKTKNDLEKINKQMANILIIKSLDANDHPPPCQVIHNMQIDYEEYDLFGEETQNDFFIIDITQGVEYFKEIEQVRAYDEETLIGNSGGYVGLFLGCGLLQVRKWHLW